jgi:pilus assembly protein CpaE
MRVMLVAASSASMTQLRNRLDRLQEHGIDVMARAVGPSECLQALRRGQPNLVVAELNLQPVDAIELARQVKEQYPRLPVVILAPPQELRRQEEAQLARVPAFIVVQPGLTPEALADKLWQVYRANPPPTPGREEAAPPVGPGRIWGVVGTKGGTGRSTVALNVAAILAQHNRDRIALLDFDLQFGDVGVALNLAPRPNLYTLRNVIQALEPGSLKQGLQEGPYGLQVLVAPEHAAEAMDFAVADLAELLNVCRQVFALTIVDTSAQFDPGLTATLGEADTLLLVTTPDYRALRNNHRLIHHLIEERRFPADQIRVVVNQVDSHLLGQADLKRILGLPVFGQLPTDPECAWHMANDPKGGTCLKHPGLPLSKGLQALTERLAPEELKMARPQAAAPRRRGILSFL